MPLLNQTLKSLHLRADYGGRSVRVEAPPYTFSPAEAREFAGRILELASQAERLPRLHENHVNLKARCALCVAEAGAQTDRLTYDDDDDDEVAAIEAEHDAWVAEGERAAFEMTEEV